MKVRLVSARSIAAAALIAGIVALAGCATVGAKRGPTAVSGTIRDDVVTLRAPLLQRPVLDAAVGIPGTRSPRRATSAAGASSVPTLSATLVSLETSQGSSVATGQIVARLDTRDLVLGVQIARAAAAKAHAEIDVLGARLADLEKTADTLASNRATVMSSVTNARSGRAQLVANIAMLERLIAHMPPGGSIPPSMPPGPRPPDPRVLLAKLKATLARLDAGLAQATSGLAKIDTGTAKLADARSLIRGARSVLREVATATDAGVPVAQAKLAQATLRSPTSGVVIDTAAEGAVLMADAPVVRLRRAGPAVIDTYLTAEDVARVRVGARTVVSIDSLPGREFDARVTEILPAFEYPPTALPTIEIHMTRAFHVVVTLDRAADALPAGTPADLAISTD